MSGGEDEEKAAGTRMARRTDDRRRVEPPAPERVERAADAVEALPWAPARVGRTRVLFLVANSSRAPVNAEAEERKIRDRIAGGRFSFEKVPDVRAEDLFAVLRDQRPAMVHFSGHGHGAAGLAMKNRDGLPTSITARELALHFRDLAAQGVGVRCVVLNACLAEEQALAVAPYVDFVVGTTALVGDEVAVTFADNFYLALAEGRAVRQAFEAARARCGGDVAGAEGTFRLFYSEPRAPRRRAGVAVAVAALAAVAVAAVVAVSGVGGEAREGDAGIAGSGRAGGEGAGMAAAGPVGGEVAGAVDDGAARGGAGAAGGEGAARGGASAAGRDGVAGAEGAAAGRTGAGVASAEGAAPGGESGAAGAQGAGEGGNGAAQPAAGTASGQAGAVAATATPRRVVRRGRLCARDLAERRNVVLAAECECVGLRAASTALQAQLDRDPGDCRARYTCARVDKAACR